MLKLMSSSIYEILLYNARKNNIDNKLVTNLKRFKELNSSPRFKESYPIDENKLIMKLPSDKIELKYPLFVGWFVLELSKLHMYDFYYNVLKENYGNDVNLVYMDTDSFLLDFKNVDVYKEMHKEHMDPSNFPTDYHLYEENKGKLGLLKSETGDNPISQVICLAPECYSVLLEDGAVKNTTKGVNRSQKANFRHDTYRDVHDGIVKEIRAPCSTIRSIKNKLCTVIVVRKALSKMDRKRFWLNPNESAAYGHPKINQLRNQENDGVNVKLDKKRKISYVSDENYYVISKNSKF